MVDTPWFYLLISRAEFVHIIFLAASACTVFWQGQAQYLFHPQSFLSGLACLPLTLQRSSLQSIEAGTRKVFNP